MQNLNNSFRIIRENLLLTKVFITLLLAFSLSVSLFGQDKNQMKNTHLYNAQVEMDKEGKLPAAIRFQKGNQPTVDEFLREYRQFFSISDDNQLKAVQESSNKIGVHHRFNQFYKGIEVLGAQYILHEKNGAVWYANGLLVSGIDPDITPGISEEAALQAALKYINADTYMWEKQENEEFLKREQKDDNATFLPKGELKLTSGKEEIVSKNVKLVYRFDIYAQQPVGRYWVDVDARTGEIVNKLDRMHEVDVIASNTTLYNGTQDITVDDDGAGTFTTQEHTTRSATILTYDLGGTGNFGAATLFSSGTSTGFSDAAGVSTHFGAEATYDYYLNEHGRNSIDGSGLTILSYAHYLTNLNNAYWDGSRMLYGDGDGVNFTPLVGLDVCGHELTHGVTQYSSDLIYSGESGGLNESFSDIFGNLVEFYEEGGDPGVGGAGWRIGEDITTSGLGIRNMANPNEFNDPDTYLGDYWVNEVHTTSGVQNFWFYLLTEGGSGTNDNGDAYSVTGIGLVDAAAIAYHNNTSFLIPSSNYHDARNGAIACAEALFGAGSQQALSTADAWDAVGVYYIAPPANDDIADAIAVSCGSTTAGTTIGATFDTGAPACDFAHTAPGVWYQFTGTGDFVTANLCNGATTYDSRLTVYEGSPGSLTCINANDDYCGLRSQVEWNSVAGTEYLILVHGFGSSVGSFELTLTCVGPPATALAGVCYASTGVSDGGRLLTIDPVTGAGTLIGSTGLSGVPGLAINSSGEIFGTERISGDLYRIDAVTGGAFLIGGTGVSFLDAIAFDENDVLYGIGYDPPDYNLRIINTQTGASTIVGPTGDAITGMAFDPTDGQLYGSFGGFDAINPDNIARIDKTTGTVTYIGTTGIGGPTPDLCFDASGNLYGSKGGGSQVNDLISINKSNGTGTVIGSIGFSSVSGMSSSVGDITPPVITVADPLSLWPPNHKYETIDLAQCIVSVEDDVDGSIPVSDVVIEMVSSDEPDNARGNGDGNTINDMVIDSDCKSVDLRRERQGNGNGRVYTIHVSVSDAAGNVGTATCLVTVPHNKNGTAIDDGPVNTVVSDCASTLAKFTGNGSGQENNLLSTVPENYALEQNYPNPFNPSTVIRYALPENAKVTLVVYDILGSQVAELVNGNIAGGIHEVAFDASNLTSGIYFYRLTAGSYTQINKMILLK